MMAEQLRQGEGIDINRIALDWASARAFEPLHVDCITAVMLKILDGKCKMGEREQTMITSLYAMTSNLMGLHFDQGVHKAIGLAVTNPREQWLGEIHALRLRAEQVIPKPVMKAFKQHLRESLFSGRLS
ncbi:MAG: hypothetical protein ABW131_15860 [Candidatus Sedimenticola sp. 6PFRAG5]